MAQDHTQLQSEGALLCSFSLWLIIHMEMAHDLGATSKLAVCVNCRPKICSPLASKTTKPTRSLYWAPFMNPK